MSKHYNLTVTDDNGKSVTTSNTSTEHPEEVLRMMHLAGMQSQSDCGCGESIEEETEYKPTPANDKLDLDDYSKKSPESIAKQKKSLDKAPSRGDNPLEYSLDESEIYESLMDDFIEDEIKETTDEKVEEGMEADEVKAMFMSYPEDAEKVKATGQLDPDSQLYMDLFGYYQDEMPYGTQKARDGDPTEWLEMRLSDLGMMESTNEETQKQKWFESYEFIAEEKCRYCGGDCPDDPNHACDGFIGDIDNLYGSYDEEGEDEMDENAELNRLRKLANLPQETEQPTEEVTQEEEVVAEEEDMYAWFNAKTGDLGYGKKAEMSNWTHYMPASDFTYFSGNDDYKGYDEEVAKQEGWIAVGAEESEKIDELPIAPLVGMAAKKIGGALIKKAVKTGANAVKNQVSNATNNQQ